MRLRGILATLLAMAGVMLGGATATANAADCSVHSDGLLWCGNDVPAYLRTGMDLTWPYTGELTSSYSWFQCWSVGQQHSGGNNIWYYTKGDVALNGYNGWGWIPAVNVYTTTDPAPGLAQCAPN